MYRGSVKGGNFVCVQENGRRIVRLKHRERGKVWGGWLFRQSPDCIVPSKKH